MKTTLFILFFYLQCLKQPLIVGALLVQILILKLGYDVHINLFYILSIFAASKLIKITASAVTTQKFIEHLEQLNDKK